MSSSHRGSGGAGSRRPGTTRDDIGDTSQLVRRSDHASLEVGQVDAASATPDISIEIADLLLGSLKATPLRSDLRMMLFEVYARLSLRRELYKAVDDAARDAAIRGSLDWLAVQRVLQDLAPVEGLSDAAQAAIDAATRAAASANAQAAVAVAAVAPRTKVQRFSEVATQIAGEALAQLTRAYGTLRGMPGFFESFAAATGGALKRPTPLFHASKFGRAIGGGANIYVKREDLRPQLAEVENAVAQVWLAKALNKHTLVSGNDQDAHARALARVASRFSMPCVIFVRPVDLEGKATLVGELRQLGADVRSSAEQQVMPFDPREAALRHWQTALADAHLALSLGTGPRPYPIMVNDFRSLLGRETQQQYEAAVRQPREPAFVAAANSGADAIGFMLPQLNRAGVELACAEPPGGQAATALSSNRMRAFHGSRREHSWLRGSGRVHYERVLDERAAALREQLSLLEGIHVGLEDGRAVALAESMARGLARIRDIVILVAAAPA